MDQKHIGVILLIVAVLIGSFVFIVQNNNDDFAKEYVADEGTCFLDDGTCLHKQNLPLYIFGWTIAGVLFLFGAYLTFFDKTQKMIAEHQIKISSALESAKRHDREKDEFNAYLAGFSEEEQIILKAIREQQGIKQSTLRFRTNISKTSLSLILSNLEDKEIIKRKVSGKTKEVYLVKKF
jgi:DNA-binding MarR family transcriptional regulator